MLYDIVVIGSGIIGSCIARELSKYNLKICVLEKESDVSCGSSKANSGIVHAGFDPKPGTLMANLNVQGALLYPELSKKLNFSYKNNGSLVLAFSEKDMNSINYLCKQGNVNGVPNLSILSKIQLSKYEENLSEKVVGALLAESSGIVSPYQATWAFAENAAQNGAEFFFNTHVINIEKEENFEITTNKQTYFSKCVINAAGLFSDRISNMAGAKEFKILPRRGEYFLLDNKLEGFVKHTIFQTPDKSGKGVLVTPTVDGNILVGPTAVDECDKENVETTSEGQEFILQKAKKSISYIPNRQIINVFAGNRALPYNMDGTPIKDFIIEEDKNVKNFINVAGIGSPGLSSAPAIGIYVSDIVKELFKNQVIEKNDFEETRKGIVSFKELSEDGKKQIIKQNPLYGRIICRCETITEGEIVNSIHSVLGAKDLDGVKRRTRSGMGRCQGGFCAPRITEILSRELNIEMTDVTKKGNNSYLLDSKIR